jgi:hypothetical protein
MKFRLLIASFATLATLSACDQTKGKAELANSPRDQAAILEACADGTHANPHECSNAKSIENSRKLEQSLGR